MLLAKFSADKRCLLKYTEQLLTAGGNMIPQSLPIRPVVGVDAHIHLTELLARTGDQDLEEVLHHQPGNIRLEVGGVVSNHCFPNRWPGAREREELRRDSRVHLSFGIHPKAATRQPQILQRLQTLLDGRGVVAVGEIGLDFSRFPTEGNRRMQKEMLHQILLSAVQRGLPIILHCRGNEEESAVQECMEVFQGVVPRGHSIHFHCFMGSWEEATRWRACFPNTMFGLTGAIFRRQDKERLKEVIRKLPLERMLLESDAPFISTTASSIGNPRMIWDVAVYIAKQKNLLVDTVVEATRKGAVHLYNM